MTLMDIMNKGKKYKIQVRCKNCGEVQEVSVPKGITIEDYFKQGMGKCENCGCSTLEHLKSFLENTDKFKKVYGRKGEL
jgi:transcription elongation factor Elf1